MTAPLSQRLKSMTGETHDRLDRRIMAAEPFADIANYRRFLAVQYAFHRDLDALYADPVLASLLPDLSARNRLERIGADLADLDAPVPAADGTAPFAPGAIELPPALGWLYVAEGSNLGAAFLYKAAAALGLDGDRGARHLAGHPDGRARHWRAFTGALDGLSLSGAEDARVIDGARAAFTRVHALVERHFA
ncbi:biliverdin-producing heme oxygenase [Sphingomonas colocasiae]|uniref:Biliverdin-producing heme oxygenase n=2 Tax=Sphingomonas colocasiae TaxID=1848973 RepID=A0ABS7PVB9_9SPHN|nr:biliverdin-producing heme oxygenase [Sphingomonas colocasiae]